jgi:histidine ammonia-lyase
VAQHKRAVGLEHEARRASAPASLGATETSLGQEDVQSFALEAMRAAEAALQVLRDVTASELVAVHQAAVLDETLPIGSERLRTVLHKAFEDLPRRADDRPAGPDVAALMRALHVGWAHDLAGAMCDASSHHSPPAP